MWLRSDVQHCCPVGCRDVCTAAESIVWLPSDIKLKPVSQEGDSHLYLIPLESLAYSSMAYIISFWQINKYIYMNVGFHRIIHLYIMHLQKDYVLWCSKNTNSFEGSRRECLFKAVLCQVPAVLQKSDSVRGQEMLCGNRKSKWFAWWGV